MLQHSKGVPDPFSIEDIVTISDEVTHMGNVTGRVTSSFTVEGGKTTRYYALDVNSPELVHKDFRDLVAYGLPVSCLKLYSKPQLPQEILLTQTEKALNACLDGGATYCVVNSKRIIVPGTERDVDVTATLSDKREMSFSEGGIIHLKRRDGKTLNTGSLSRKAPNVR
jgi:hypothetical protein